MSDGERDLATLLKSLKVVIRPGAWVFRTQAAMPDPDGLAMVFRESEGWTLIRAATDSDSGPSFSWLELSVHSSLEAVGFLAAVSGALAKAGIPCNAVAAYHHDHVFVPKGEAERAKQVIEELARQA